MLKRCQSLAVVLALSSVPAWASTGGHPYESCLTGKALALEATGIAVDEVIATAVRFCKGTRAETTNADAAEIDQQVRLAVMQQRSNARNTLRRF